MTVGGGRGRRLFRLVVALVQRLQLGQVGIGESASLSHERELRRENGLDCVSPVSGESSGRVIEK